MKMLMLVELEVPDAINTLSPAKYLKQKLNLKKNDIRFINMKSSLNYKVTKGLVIKLKKER